MFRAIFLPDGNVGRHHYLRMHFNCDSVSAKSTGIR